MDMEQGKNADYWRDITTVTEDELAQLRKIDPNTKGNFGNYDLFTLIDVGTDTGLFLTPVDADSEKKDIDVKLISR